MFFYDFFLGYNSGPGNDTRTNRSNQPGSYNGMFQSDDQQLFIGKIPPEVQESDLRVRIFFIYYYNFF